MPTRIPVSIAEIVEVRGGALADTEVVAVLAASCQPLAQLLNLARLSEVQGSALGPGTVFVLEDGSVQIKPVHRSAIDERFLPPEYDGIIDDDFINESNIDLEKVLVYSMGSILLYALEADGIINPATNPELLSLINLMMVRDPKTRPPINRLEQMAGTRASNLGVYAPSLIQTMHTSIMGDGQDEFSLEIYDEDAGMEASSSSPDYPANPAYPETGFEEMDTPTTGFREDSSPEVEDVDEKEDDFEKYIEQMEKKQSVANLEPEPDLGRMEPDSVMEKPDFGKVDPDFESQDDGKREESLNVDLPNDSNNVVELGSPVGHSTAIDVKDVEITETGNDESWVSFDTPKSRTDAELSDIFGTPMAPPEVKGRKGSGSSQESKTENTENTLDVDEGSNTKDPFTYDRLEESTELPHDPFENSRENGGNFLGNSKGNDEEDPFRTETVKEKIEDPFVTAKEEYNHNFDVVPTKTMQEFTSEKNHGKLESCRSCHSVDCQFCSPNKTPLVGKQNESKEGQHISLPNLVEAEMMEEGPNCDTTHHELYAGNRKILIGQQNKDVDPFASFDDLAHLERREKSLERNTVVSLQNTVEMKERTPSTSSSDEEQQEMQENRSESSEDENHSDSEVEVEDIVLDRIDEIEEHTEENKSSLSHIEPTILVVEKDGLKETKRVAPLSPEDDKVSSQAVKRSPMYERRSPMPQRRKHPAPSVPPPVPPPRRLSTASESSQTSEVKSVEDEGEGEKSDYEKKGEYSPNKEGDSEETVKKPVPAPRSAGSVSKVQASSFRRAGSMKRGPGSLRSKQRPTSTFQPPSSELLVGGSATLPRSARQEKNMNSLRPMAGPEFLHSNRLPSIRLRAPPTNKRRKLLSRIDMNQVQVMLLNGQPIVVECRTDSLAGDVFDLVVTHTNLSEHFFFGLSVLQDGEHFFMEPDCKLSKYAPPGWKHARKNRMTRIVYTIYLRLKYYPATLEFIKTEHTLHEMYLQLRRDLIDERIHIDRDSAYSMAAVALQAEFGDRKGEKIDYFEVEHYMPHHHLMEELGGEARIRSNLSELHSQYAGQSQQDAEIEFLKQCISQKEYSIHFHRLYKTKPSQNLVPTPLGDPDTGTLLWVGIMPKGVIVFEEKGGERIPVYQHPWHLTQTLQFDRKRFVVVTQTNESSSAKKHIYFTDSYKKSSYFVNFAAAQHRFCMKMRNWAATLTADPSKARFDMTPHAAVNAHRVPSSSGQSSDSGVPDMSREASPDEKMPAALRGRKLTPPEEVLDVNEPSPNKSVKLNDESFDPISKSFAERLADAELPTSPTTLTPDDFIQLKATLRKDPQFGLGLTLVDGDIKGIKGVYVKSVTKGGPAETEGRLKIGDKLVSVNGYDLQGKDRHYVVSLVQKSSEIRLEAMRLKDLYSGSEESLHKASTSRIDVIERRLRDENGSNLSGSLPMYSSQDIESALKAEAREEDRGRSLPVSSLTVPNANRSRSASAGGFDVSRSSSRDSVHDTSGEFDVASANHVQLQEHDTTNDNPDANTSIQGKRYFDQKHRSNVSQILYNGLNSDSEGEGSVDSRLNQPGPGASREDLSFDAKNTVTSYSSNKENLMNDSNKEFSTSTPYQRGKSELDWADDISMGDSNLSWDDQIEESDPMQVVLSKNDSGGLGIKIAGGSQGQKRVYIKALVSEPALSCTQIRPGDRLVTVNGSFTEGLSHHDVVALLKNAASPVTLGLLRRRNALGLGDPKMETLTVTLEKPASGSLGLSLARPSGGKGIYVRVINDDSPAAIEGTLKVGDRLWKINEDSVEEASPYDVVEKLRAADRFVTLVVKREL